MRASTLHLNHADDAVLPSRTSSQPRGTMAKRHKHCVYEVPIQVTIALQQNLRTLRTYQ